MKEKCTCGSDQLQPYDCKCPIHKRKNKKFRLSDLVYIKKDLPKEMAHFPNDKDAIITEYSHNKAQIGNDWEHTYQVYIKNFGPVAWYYNSNLELIKHNQAELLDQWQEENK